MCVCWCVSVSATCRPSKNRMQKKRKKTAKKPKQQQKIVAHFDARFFIAFCFWLYFFSFLFLVLVCRFFFFVFSFCCRWLILVFIYYCCPFMAHIYSLALSSSLSVISCASNYARNTNHTQKDKKKIYKSSLNGGEKKRCRHLESRSKKVAPLKIKCLPIKLTHSN